MLRNALITSTLLLAVIAAAFANSVVSGEGYINYPAATPTPPLSNVPLPTPDPDEPTKPVPTPTASPDATPLPKPTVELRPTPSGDDPAMKPTPTPQ